LPKKINGSVKCPHCNGTGEIALAEATVGDMILAARKARQMTQEKLAGSVGLSRAQIANIEAGRSDVPLKTLARFADALGTTMRDLVPG
jgi:transcriptional regulator with XRE-family HTH domain